MKKFGLLCLLVMALTPWSAFAGQTPCATTGGAIDAHNTINTLNSCAPTPQGYSLTIYKLGLCKSNPSPHGSTTPDFSSCHILLENTAGQSTQLAAGSSIALPGATLPPYGTYEYAVLVVNNQIGIKSTQTYSANMTGSAGGTGTTCWSVAGTTDRKTPAPNLITCGLASAAAPAITINAMTDMDGSNNDPSSAGTLDVEGCSAPSFFCTVSVGRISAKLATSTLDSTFATLNTGWPANITRIIAVEEFDAAHKVTITPRTSNLDVAFNVTNGSGHWITGGGGLCDAIVCTLQAYGTAPFSMIITAK